MTTPHLYQRGDVVRITGEFYYSTSTATYLDPSAVYAAYINPSGSTVGYTYGTSTQLVKSSTGTYYFDITSTASGDYHARVWSSGTGAAAAVTQFRIQGDHFSGSTP